MSQPTLEDRVKQLEDQVDQLQAALGKVAENRDWRSTLGMFAGDEVMRRIDAAGQAIREQERRRATDRRAKARQSKK
jgi:hypothetical protein